MHPPRPSPPTSALRTAQTDGQFLDFVRLGSRALPREAGGMAKIGKKTAKRPRADKHKGKKHNQRAIGARTLQRAPPRRPGGGQGEGG